MTVVQLLEVLISLGLTTVTQAKDLLTSQTSDDTELAAMLADLDRRLARRS